MEIAQIMFFGEKKNKVIHNFKEGFSIWPFIYLSSYVSCFQKNGEDVRVCVWGGGGSNL